MRRRMLVDVSSVLRRYYHTMDAFDVPESLKTQMYRVKDRYRVDELILAFDGRDAATWRREIFPGYKADRENDLDVRRCVRDFYKSVIEDFHCEVVPKFEADDVIATIAEIIRQHAPDDMTIIYSRDKDFHALLSDKLWQLMECVRGREDMVMTADKLFGKFGLKPCQWVEYLMIMGDHTDGIPGLDRWGEIYAQRVLKACGSIENALKVWDKLPVPKHQRETLVSSHENGDLAILRQLVTMRTDVPVKFTLIKPKEGVDASDSERPDSPVL